MCSLIKKYNAIHHLITDNAGRDDEQLMLKSLLSQVYMKNSDINPLFPDDVKALEMQWTSVLYELAEKQNGEKIVVVIDGLDELNGNKSLGFLPEHLPENVYIIATMNEIDRSIEFMDFAMQRRFKKINITADISMHRMNISKLRQEVMVAINTAILNTEGLGEKYQLGGSFFNDESVSLQELWDDDLSCLLKDYLQGIDPDSTKYELLKSVYFNAIKIG